MPAPLPVTYVAIQRIRDLRKRWDMTAAELAERMTKVGYRAERTQVAHAERGTRREISVDWLVAAAAVFNVEPASLLEPLPACRVCHGAPLPGFACIECGTTTKETP